MQHAHSISGAHAFWEYAVVVAAVIVLIWVLYLAFKYTVWPGEEEPDHIKRRILEDRGRGGTISESSGMEGQGRPEKGG